MVSIEVVNEGGENIPILYFNWTNIWYMLIYIYIWLGMVSEWHCYYTLIIFNIDVLLENLSLDNMEIFNKEVTFLCRLLIARISKFGKNKLPPNKSTRYCMVAYCWWFLVILILRSTIIFIAVRLRFIRITHRIIQDVGHKMGL